jgi:nitrogen fixation/metabolism regulation signal transduction histidine kinase
MVEVNTLSRTLYDQRLEALEAGALLQKIIADVDIAVFAFDMGLRLRIVNKAGEILLRSRSDNLQGRSAAELGLAGMLAEESGRIVAHVFPGGGGRWEIRRRSFREGGKPHELLVISELSRALREEERQAWQRIVRVIGHELNSSLAPIKSMAGTVRKLVGREPASRSFTTAPSRSSGSWAPMRDLRGCRRRRGGAPNCRRSCAASPRCTRRASRSSLARRCSCRSTRTRSSRCSST